MSFTPTFMCVMLSKGSKEVLIVSNALNSMYVKGVESGIYSFYVTLHTEYRFNVKGAKSMLCIQGSSPLQEGRPIVAISPVGLAIHQSEEAAL